MRNAILVIFTIALTLVVFTSCKKKDTSNPDYVATASCSNINDSLNRYTNSIKPILDTRCASAGCHNASSSASGVNVSTYASSKSAFQTKNVLCAVHHGNGCQPMPQGSSQLSDAEINKLDCWAKNGYKE